MSVWVCVPSARPPAEQAAWAAKWRTQGYSIAIWRDGGERSEIDYDFCQVGEYPGYAQATNALIKWVIDNDSSCDWCVAGGDDVYPDPNLRADEIAAQCSRHFSGAFECCYPPDRPKAPYGSKYFDQGGSGKDAGSYIATATFGVMQPTGHRWGDDASSRAMWPTAPAYIDRIAGSPWIGREFARRINGGKGPLWPEYHHCWSDQELQELATTLGVFWQRRDLTHFHNHWMLEGKKEPAHLVEANKTYQRDKPLFQRRQAAGFPGHEPLP